jgi:general secretion pathway protein D
MLRKRLQLAGAIAGLALCLSCGGGTSAAYRAGRKAEERKDWDTAIVDYEKAVQADPANALYILHESQARSQAAAMHLANGRRMEKEGRLEDAAGEFKKASGIDPSNAAAVQELNRVTSKLAETKQAHTTALQQALKAREETAEAPGVQLQPFPKEPLSHIRIPNADSRMVFQTLAKLAGLNVAFTSDFRPSPANIDLTNIKIEDALKVVSLQTKNFYRPVTPNTILVIPDNPNNRRDYDEEIIRTIHLNNPLAPADRTAITTALKQVLNMQRIMDNPDSNSIIIRDTPAKVAAAEQLVHQLDRGKAEILLGVDIVEADRDRIRDLGITPATISSSGTTTAGIQTGAAYVSPVSTTSTTTTTVSPGQAAINTLTYKNIQAVIPGITASAILNDNRTHIMQSPQVRVTDGATAKLKIGTRIPYATGSFLPSLGGTTSSSSGGIGLLASTQFQFQDVGVNLELTPHLLASGEVAVHAKIEISSLGASISVGGITEPTFGQRVIEDDFRLQEGEVNLLGGLIQRTLTEAVTGVPGLGDIPLIRYLFSQENKEVNDQEVLVMLTPRVIRLPEPAIAAGGALPVGAAGETGVPGVPENFPPEGPVRPGVPPVAPQ